MAYKFIVWIDGDSCPKKVKDFLFNYSKSKSFLINVVANRKVELPTDNPFINLIIVENLKDAADNHIFDNSSLNDIVVTRDILFAQRLVEKKVTVMNDRGLIFNEDNIQDKLREREFSMNLSAIGFGGGKNNYYGEKEIKKFIAVFEREFQTHVMNEIYNIKL